MINEIESKLNVPSEALLQHVGDYILNSPYYMANDVHVGAININPLHLERTYFDSLSLDGFKNGVEIRIEHKSKRSESSKKPYKMTIKVSLPQNEENIAVDRLEACYRIDEAQPDLSVIEDSKIKKAVKQAFGVKNLKDINLLPLVRVLAQRWKYSYRPGGDPNTKIEFDSASGQVHDFTGQAFDLYQIELESKEGDPQAVEIETTRLTNKFNFLSIDTNSKPALGFERLQSVLMDKDIKKYAEEHLDNKAFRILNRIPGIKNN